MISVKNLRKSFGSVEVLRGVDLDIAEKDLEAGRYEEAAKAAGYVVYAEPDNLRARYIQADSFEQLGYRAESSVWRNAYLSGADELRKTENDGTQGDIVGKGNIVAKLSPRMLLDFLGIVTDGEKIADQNVKFRLTIVDPEESGDTAYFEKRVKKVTEFSVHVYYGTLLYYEGSTDEKLPYVTVPEKLLPLIIDTERDDIFKFADTDIPEVIKTIRDAIVNIPKNARFSIIG